MFLDVKVTPGASKNEILDVREGRLRIKIAAAPEDGKANAALIAFLADKLGAAKRDVVLVAGEKSREKRLQVPDGAADYLNGFTSKTVLHEGQR